MGDSAENTCRIPQDAPRGNDIRYHLEKYDDMTELENNINKALHDRLPPRIYKGKQTVTDDPNLIPWYGKPSLPENRIQKSGEGGNMFLLCLCNPVYHQKRQKDYRICHPCPLG